MYVELHCKTNFSFLEGASHADELVARAAELGYAALAITDRNSLAGIVRAHMAAKDCGLKLIVGAEIHPSDAPPVVLWATDRRSYGRLSRLITQGRRRAEKGECELTFDDIAEHAEGLVAGVLPGEGERGLGTGDRKEEWELENRDPKKIGCPTLSVFPGPQSPVPGPLHAYRDLFGDRGYLLAEVFRGPDDVYRLQQLDQLSRETG